MKLIEAKSKAILMFYLVGKKKYIYMQLPVLFNDADIKGEVQSKTICKGVKDGGNLNISTFLVF